MRFPVLSVNSVHSDNGGNGVSYPLLFALLTLLTLFTLFPLFTLTNYLRRSPEAREPPCGVKERMQDGYLPEFTTMYGLQYDGDKGAI